ncbi:STAS domain-containing protein [Chromobacterium sphagni]|uniref:STAS domain-containing protein n=1 Tax=Chromobacterium sphagni TaxID=1903179 RepID=A0A1S1X3C2_9NEIS|nr:STAS domain-containing protein [Chromobacterium sphagni]OHX13979.1 hypothetical protein BI347_11000 [Chromobacterium sphagni]OHX20187.1 hypothetical protein BI344_06690 [Chromobacterium sphagni]
MPLSIRAGNEQTIYQAAELLAQLRQALRGEEAILLDLSAVEEIDCAGAQVLVWLLREGSRLGLPVSLHAPSKAVRDFVRLMGLQRDLPLEAQGEDHGHGS